MTYPTAADLRQAANEAILRRCDDPLLREMMAFAASEASTGRMSCRFAPNEPLGPGRFTRIVEACEALGVRCEEGDASDGPPFFELSWS
jgi:hypothetical protein